MGILGDAWSTFKSVTPVGKVIDYGSDVIGGIGEGVKDTFSGETINPYDPNATKYSWGGKQGMAQSEADRLRLIAENAGRNVRGQQTGGWEEQRNRAEALGGRAMRETSAMGDAARTSGVQAGQIGARGADTAGRLAGGAQGREGPVLQRTSISTVDPRTQESVATQAQALRAAQGADNMNDLEAARQIRGRQVGVADAFRGFREQPAGPSAAEAQLRLGTDQANAAATSLARSGRGPGGNASAAREAMFTNVATNQRMGNELAKLRAEEEAARRGQDLQAMTGEAAALAGARGQDIQTGETAGGLGLEGARLQSDIGTRQGDLAMSEADLLARQRQAQAELAAQQNISQAGLTDAQRARNDAYEMNLRNLGFGYDQMRANVPATYLDLEQRARGLGYGTQAGAIGAGMGSLRDENVSNLGFETAATGRGFGYEQLGQNPYNEELRARALEEGLRSGNIMGAQEANQRTDLQRDLGILGLGTSLLGMVPKAFGAGAGAGA